MWDDWPQKTNDPPTYILQNDSSIHFHVPTEPKSTWSKKRGNVLLRITPLFCHFWPSHEPNNATNRFPVGRAETCRVLLCVLAFRIPVSSKTQPQRFWRKIHREGHKEKWLSDTPSTTSPESENLGGVWHEQTWNHPTGFDNGQQQQHPSDGQNQATPFLQLLHFAFQEPLSRLGANQDLCEKSMQWSVIQKKVVSWPWKSTTEPTVAKEILGCFQKWGYPQWMVYKGKPY